METTNQNLPPVPPKENNLIASQPVEKKSSKLVIIWIIAGIFLFCILLGIAGVVSAIFLAGSKKKINNETQNSISENQIPQSFVDTFQNSSDKNIQGDESISLNEDSQYSEEDVNFTVDYECAYIEAENEIKKEGIDIHSVGYSVQYSNALYEKMKVIMSKYGISGMKELGDKAMQIYEWKNDKNFKQQVDLMEKQRGCIVNN